MRTAMRVHFLHIHVWYIVVIMKEGNLPHPRFPQCDMLAPWKTLNGRHITTNQCAKGAEQKSRRMVAEDLQGCKAS